MADGSKAPTVAPLEQVGACIRALQLGDSSSNVHQLAKLLKLLAPDDWTDEMSEKLVASTASNAKDVDDLVKWIWALKEVPSGIKPTEGEIKTVAGAHVQDLIMAWENWRDIRPERYVSERDDTSGAVRQEPSTGAFLQRIKVYSGVNMSEQAHMWRSKTFDALAEQCRARVIDLPGESAGSITFGTIFDMITSHDKHCYIYGGVCRDVLMKGFHVADDIDVLFTCDVQELCTMCETRGWKLGTHYHLKKDEKTGEYRWNYISIGKGKEKFSGHTLDSNCAGEFTFNCILYDLQRSLLIDATGWGIRDAVQKRLRIPFDGGRLQEWDHWSEMCDRLPGMISLRFFNFRSRGYTSSGEVVAHNVKWIKDKGKDSAEAVRVFLKRKVLGKQDEEALQKLKVFRDAVKQDFDTALGDAAGEVWLTEHLDPIAADMISQWKK